MRITRTEDREAGVITLKFEGRIVSEWVGVLERECRTALQEVHRVQADLSGVTFIDGRGVQTLRLMRNERLQIVNCSAFLDDLLRCGGNR